jgi:hypothetical protein
MRQFMNLMESAGDDLVKQVQNAAKKFFGGPISIEGDYFGSDDLSVVVAEEVARIDKIFTE